jgi:hypothetical protein
MQIDLTNCGTLTRASLYLLLVSSLAADAGAQSIDAHEVGTGNAVIHNWEAWWGSYDRDYLQTKRLRVTVRDVTRRVREAEVLVYFVGRRLPAGDRFIYSHHQIPVVFHGNIEVTGDVPAPSIKSNQQNYVLARRRYSSGAEIDGWIVIGREGSRVFDTRASAPSLLERARENSQEPDSLRAMLAAAGIHDEPARPPPPQTQADSRHQPPQPAAVLSPSSSPPQFTTLVKAVSITLPYGEATLQPGTKLQVISRDVRSAQILYGNATITIPISSTDLK